MKISDVELYRLIVHTNLTLSDVGASPSAGVRELMESLTERLGSGWFASKSMSNPQSRYGERAVPSEIGETYVGGSDKPAGAVWTSSYLPDGTSAWAQVEDVSGLGANRPLRAIRVAVRESRVLHIGSLKDYVDLVERYPDKRVHGRVLARWRVAARDYDAVHLTTRGLVETHRRVVSSEGGRLVELRGWDAECTAWLVDRFETVAS
ncbi:MAG: hypothetical protein M3Z25_13985 [Actinomycetota bacterium]|nr:hypothetical protein [Actinomycetota bacterium]